MNNVDKWISVKDRLPDRKGLESDEIEYVIVCESSPYWQGCNVSICGFGIDGWSKFDNFGLIDSDNITHWMPLPKPPEGE